jgi:hypothetical protein
MFELQVFYIDLMIQLQVHNSHTVASAEILSSLLILTT